MNYTTVFSAALRQSRRALLSLLATVALIAFVASSAFAQSQMVTDGGTPSALAPGAPEGSYSLSGFETVNPYNGGLNFSLPLLKVGGRGGAGYAVTLRIDQKWTIRKDINPGHSANYYPTPSWLNQDTLAVDQTYSVGKLTVKQGATRDYSWTLTRLFFTAPDGTEYELRDTAQNGVAHHVDSSPGSGSFDRGRIFVTTDGSSATFIADADVTDWAGGDPPNNPPAGYMILKDGTRFRIGDSPAPAGAINWMRDRDGNLVTFTYDTNTQKLSSVTDSLGRVVTISNGSPTTITYKGFGAVDRTVTINIAALSSATLRSGFQIRTVSSLFPGLNEPTGSLNSTPQIISSVVLPNGQSYQFSYDDYGELARVVLPTGGAIEYDYAPGLTDGDASGMLTDSNNEKQVYRRIVERRVYPSGGSGSGYSIKQVYSRPESSTANAGYVDVQQCTSGPAVGQCGTGAALLSHKIHYYYGSPRLSFNRTPVDYTGWQEGKEYKTEVYDPQSGVLLRKVENTWQQPVDGSAWPLTQAETNSSVRSNNPQITQVLTTLADTNQLSKQTFSYDQYGNRTDTYEYDFGAVGSGTFGSFLRRTHIDYVTTAAYVNASATPSSGASLRGLPSQQWVSSDTAGSNKASLTTYSYDQYSLTDCPGIIGHDATYTTGFTTRGNVTSVTTYSDAAGGTGAITATSHYDIAGNVVSATDPNGNTSSVSYSDSFSDGNNYRNTYTYPTSTTSAIPDTTNTYGTNTPLTTSTVYDFSTGLVTSSTDANGKTTSAQYSDVLDRLTQVSRPDGGYTTYSYVDSGQCGAYVETHTLLDTAGRLTDSLQYSDGLGRPYLSETYENQDVNNPYLRVDTQYDSMGRAYRASNPYRSPGCTSAVNPSGQWTTTGYDALGRATSVTTPDGAAVVTSYSGSTVTVTDQAGKKRNSVSDALGRLTQVTEDPTTGGLNYQTTYTYDVLGNLRKVNQGSQIRYFMYDSLSRLIRTKNPEQAAGSSISNMTDTVTGNTQWSMAYGYDSDGNMTSRIDARNVTTNYAYDHLNRNTTVTHTGESVHTPDVNHYYDAATNGRGRLYWTQTIGVSATVFDGYDVMGRPTQYRQNFWVNGAWSANYSVTRTYDRAGHVLTETYPSGHSVSYNYDIAGRLADNGSQLAFTGNIGDGVSRTYSTQDSYSPFGGITQEQFGTQTALYHKLRYNARGQLYDIRLSTGSDADSWNRGMLLNHYGSGDFTTWGTSGTNNNGNVLRSHHYVPKSDQADLNNLSTYTVFYQDYEYDQLNRLTKVTETNTITWTTQYVQAYSYDQYGNRTINQSLTSNAPNTQFTVDAATNRLGVPSGQSGSMTYDAAGNLTLDSYTGNGTRTYDAENRMTTAQDSYNGTSTYTYDADGQRIKRANIYGETWQVYGIGGELLAEYASGAAPYLPQKEYGYRNGELLVTMTSGNSQRLQQFVTNLYDGALQRDPTSTELQNGVNQLAAAGVQGESQLQTSAAQLARSLFTSTSYETSPSRTDSQYVADLYNTYLQRGPDSSGLGFWTGQAAGGVTNRTNVCNAFEASGEFQTLVATLYGTATSDNQRTESFVNNFFLGAYGRNATSTELQTNRDALNAAAAVGQSNVQTQAETMGRSLFASQVTDTTSTSDQQFVINLYEGFLQRGPDASGLSFWTSSAAGGSSNRQNVLNAFATSTAFRALSATLYRETYWLVSDHLGTPRMVVDKSGSLSGIKRHDYLPFGEELYAGTGGRTTTQGYSAIDDLRQKFTGYERDGESNLDYAQARYFAGSQGRFTSPDPLMASSSALDPQTFNRYVYAQNSPVNNTDPTGLMSEPCGADNSYEQCGGNNGFWGGEFGGTVADDNRYYGGLTANVVGAVKQYELRSSNYFYNGSYSDIVGGYEFPIYYGYNADGSLWTQFYIFEGADDSNPAWELAQEMNRRPIGKTFAVLYGGSVLAGAGGGWALSSLELESGITTLGLETSGEGATDVDAVIARGLADSTKRGLTKQLLKHQQKLLDYIEDPLASDNKGILRNAPSQEVADQIFRGRVTNLVHQILTFWEQIK